MQSKAFFDNQYKSYIKYANWTSNQDLILASKTMLQQVNNPRYVIELGSGNCTLLDNFDYPIRIGIDVSIKMLSLCQDQNILRINADVHKLPLVERFADLVLCRQIVHYCNLPELTNQIKGIMLSGGHLHIVQITDFDSVPRRVYDYWTGLRGVSERKHVGRKQLIDACTGSGFSVIAEDSIFLRVEHTWDDFFEKNQVQNTKEREVKDFFHSLDKDVYQLHHMHVDEKGLNYIRRLSLFLLSNQGID